MAKQILVVARHNQPEALRVASGLTLLNDNVYVCVLGQIEDSDAVREQLEVLEFAEVPWEVIEPDARTWKTLAGRIVRADVVYVL